MAEDENILTRWSRLKRERSGEKYKQTPAVGLSEPPPALQRSSASTDKTGTVPFDASTLPPIDSIVAGSDVRAFLQKGVPAALTRDALRRAWSSDPAIRDFIEMAENQWDFTRPDSIAGFGSLNAGDNVSELVAKALGEWGDRNGSAGENGLADSSAASATRTGCGVISSTSSGEGGDSSNPSLPDVASATGDPATTSASQQLRCDAAEGAPPTPRARHGSALPS